MQTIVEKIPYYETLLLDHIVLAVVVAFLLFMVWNGWRRGMMARIISLCSVLLTLLAEVTLYPRVLQWVNANSGWQDFFRSFGRNLFEEHAEPRYSPLYQVVGLDTLAENAGELVGEIAVKVLLFILLFIAIRLLLKAVAVLVKGLRMIGPIRWLDGLLGAVLGLAEGLIYVWLAMLAVAAFPNLQYTRLILDQILADPFLYFLYSENLITQFVAGVLR